MIKKKHLIKHNYKCDYCDGIATISVEKRWHKYEISNTGNFKEIDDWHADDREFLCDNCYENDCYENNY